MEKSLPMNRKTTIDSKTICAIATSQGGAIGIIRVSGPDSISIVDSIFLCRKGLRESKPYTVRFGKIVDEDKIIDEVLVTVFRAPNSYTGEDSAEISCHGSSYILQYVLSLLIRKGCTMAQPGEFTQRAFLNGKMDLSQAEAVADLISSTNAASHRIAMNQMRGAFSNELTLLHDQLLEMSSLLELELDFSEEDVEFADRERLVSIATAIENKLQRMIDSYNLGNVIKNGIPVAIIGAPNVGKSTLLNQLLHDDKAIVSNIEGTTRDIVEDCVQIGDYMFRFLDTAGIRNTTDTIEQLGIERSIKAAERAHIVLLLSEPGVPYPEVHTTDDQIVIRVLNKADKISAESKSSTSKSSDELSPSDSPSDSTSVSNIEISALNGQGIHELEQLLLTFIPAYDSSEVIVTSQRHLESLKTALGFIRNSKASIEQSLPTDLAAEDLRSANQALSVIIGRDLLEASTTLNSIFSHFCIGK